MKDFYKILGVSKTATDKEIKKAFRSLSMKYHPDRPNGNEAKFKEINEAHDVLMNPIKRMQYNQGETPTGSNPENGDYYDEPIHRPKFRQSPNRFNMPEGFDFPQFTHRSPFGDQFFRGNTHFERTGMFGDNDFSCENSESKEQEQLLKLSFEEMYLGGVYNIQYPKPMVIDDENITMTDTIKLTIPPKCYVGKKFRLNIPDGNNKHSIIIIIDPKKHNFYKLRDNPLNDNMSDLELKMPMSLKDSLIGFRLKMNGIDNETIVLDEDGVIDPRKPYKLSGKGFVDKWGRRGDLYIIFDIKYPEKLTREQRNKIKNVL
jgi:DnaJ-class molecular chaperone